MARIIIENKSDLSLTDAMRLVERVISYGRISNGDKQYCYLTSFDVNGAEYHVVSTLNRASDRFLVYRSLRSNLPNHEKSEA